MDSTPTLEDAIRFAHYLSQPSVYRMLCMDLPVLTRKDCPVAIRKLAMEYESAYCGLHKAIRVHAPELLSHWQFPKLSNPPPNDQEIEGWARGMMVLTAQLKAVIDRPTEPTPGYLDLIVDPVRGEVRRLGKNHDQPVNFDVGAADWHTFYVAFMAGEDGATDAKWEKD